MPILSVVDLTKSHADIPVLTGVSFTLEPKERVGLIGRNGTGKTTLLRLLAKIDDPDRGEVNLAAWASVVYLPQVFDQSLESSVLSHVLAGATNVQALASRLEALEHLMAAPEVHDDARRLKVVMEEYAQVREHYEHAGGFTLETRAKMVLSGLRFSTSDIARPLRALSGGWRVRAELARVLLTEPDLLLLDEPTNHLDLATIEWLETYLQSFPGAVIVVSHDRFLLDTVTSRTLDLEDGRIDTYPGPYSTAIVLKAERAREQQETWERQQEEIAKLQAYIYRYKAGNRATQAKSREKMLARVEAASVSAPRERRTMRMKTNVAPPSGRLVVRLNNVTKHYGEVNVLRDVSLEVFRGERIGLLGANGTGKTTLLKLMAGLDEPTSGQIKLGVGVVARYFAQEATETLDTTRTILDEILGDRPMTPQQIRTYLGRFLFSGDDVFRPIAVLSGGERQRLSLAKLLLSPPNLLLLDEPTNHLDIPSREALEAALREFPGTMIIATHDRYLLDRLATRIFTMEDQTVADFRGTYHEHRTRQARHPVSRPNPRPSSATTSKPMSKPTGPSFETIAAQITAEEDELETLGRRLADPELYREPDRIKLTRQQYEQTQARLQFLYDQLAKSDPDAPPA